MIIFVVITKLIIKNKITIIVILIKLMNTTINNIKIIMIIISYKHSHKLHRYKKRKQYFISFLFF
jgi:hypothetical protein